MNAVVATSSELEQAISQFQVAQGFFGATLAAQTGIFSLIVAAVVASIVGLYFFFNRKISRDEIKKETEAHFKDLKEEMTKGFSEKTELLKIEFSMGMSQHEKDIGVLRGQTYRTLGEFWDSQKSHSVAFIWWFRAAEQFAVNGEEKLTRLCLSSAKESVERVKFGFQLDADSIGEYQTLIKSINDTYKIEKDLLDAALKEVLSRKATPVP